MFRIERAAGASGHKVIDDERGVWIQMLCGRGRTPGGVFKLVVGETVIPFETERDYIEGPDGAGHLLTRFVFCGLSPAANVRGVAPNMMMSPSERRLPDPWTVAHQQPSIALLGRLQIPARPGGRRRRSEMNSFSEVKLEGRHAHQR